MEIHDVFHYLRTVQYKNINLPNDACANSKSAESASANPLLSRHMAAWRSLACASASISRCFACNWRFYACGSQMATGPCLRLYGIAMTAQTFDGFQYFSLETFQRYVVC